MAKSYKTCSNVMYTVGVKDKPNENVNLSVEERKVFNGGYNKFKEKYGVLLKNGKRFVQ